MGSLYWQLNDCWPVASWSGIDYFGRWKALHYFVKKAFEETILVSFEEANHLNFYVISDKLTDQNAVLKQTLIDFNGTILWQEEKNLEIPSNSSNLIQELNLIDLFTFGNPSGMVLVTDLKSDGKLIYENLQYFKKPKELELQPVKIKLEIFEKDSEFEIQLSAERLAKNVFLSTNLATDHFSDNYFDLLPGQTKRILFPKTGTLEEFKNNLKVLHLYETKH
jgi:beta-mannosidase